MRGNIDAGDILVDLLRLSGHDVTLARDGEAGLEEFDRTRPQIVFCDIGLPGIDGYEVASRMRARGLVQRPSIIAVTGYSSEKASEKAVNAGFDEYVIKPVDPNALLRLVDATLRFEAAHRDAPS